MICPQCRRAADLETTAMRHDPDHEPTGHAAEFCRDFALQVGGCPCDHRPATRAPDARRAP